MTTLPETSDPTLPDLCALIDRHGTLAVFPSILMVPAAWVFIVYNSNFRQSAVLKNGMNLGCGAVFDLGRPCLRPIAVPGYADGTPLLSEGLWDIAITDTTILGTTMATARDGGFDFAWRAEEGLVRGNDDPAHYRSLVRSAGHANPNLGGGTRGTGFVLAVLIANQPGGVQFCPTSLTTGQPTGRPRGQTLAGQRGHG